MTRRPGYTLIELVVALAVFLVIIAMVFSALSSYLAMRTADEQQMIMQQNFRFVTDKISGELRQAAVTGELRQAAVTGESPLIISPGENALGRTLQFSTSQELVTYQCSSDGSGMYSIKRNGEPVTEEMHQLLDAYFVRSGGKVLVIVVGQATYFGRQRTTSFASLVFSRNSQY